MLDGSHGHCCLLSRHTGPYARGCQYNPGPPSVATCRPLLSLQQAHRADVARKVNAASGIVGAVGSSVLGACYKSLHQRSMVGPKSSLRLQYMSQATGSDCTVMPP
ncbi:hypothetical protein NDU88_002827 [Pleurodeles waltl]|uniref:Uncharacterized protein n=1 Tax=Pleurodeles waltl TaxID=8319 RepID=A0AAV7TLR4_PLEWA|nr:hypothetical protein NDU88_002827 [Pleurodeles waltl]